MLQLKRAYDPPSVEDGYRVLVDRLWPRGLKRDSARIDLWLKDIAPSDELRRGAFRMNLKKARREIGYTLSLGEGLSALPC